MGLEVKLWNPLRTRVIPERFCGGDSVRRGAISSVCTFTFISEHLRGAIQSDITLCPNQFHFILVLTQYLFSSTRNTLALNIFPKCLCV